jgi:hypothetical protein
MAEFPIVEPDPEFQLRLIRSADDPALSSPEYQKELLEFFQAPNAEGIKVSARHWANDAVGGGGGLTGEFIIAVSALAVLARTLKGPLTAYLKKRA